MKILFDTNVYVSEAMRGKSATAILEATEQAGWRIYVSTYLLDELERVICEKLGFSRRLAILSRQRTARRGVLIVPGTSRHFVPDDPNDTPILRCALSAGVAFLVTSDRHLLSLHPYEGIQIVTVREYGQFLRERGMVRD